MIDISDITRPRTVGAYNYHPPFPEPSHTFMRRPFEVGGRTIALAIDEEDQYYSPRAQAAPHVHGGLPFRTPDRTAAHFPVQEKTGRIVQRAAAQYEAIGFIPQCPDFFVRYARNVP